jgi:hypothetical protein
MDGLGLSHRIMEPLEAKRPTTVVKCEKHNLHYDSSKMNGCVICRREAGGAPVVRTAPPRSLGKALVIGAILLLTLTLAGLYFIGVKETRVQDAQDGGFAKPTPEVSLPTKDTGGPVYSGSEGN